MMQSRDQPKPATNLTIAAACIVSTGTTRARYSNAIGSESVGDVAEYATVGTCRPESTAAAR